MVLSNYVALSPGIPTRFHFTDDYFIDRWIATADPAKPKRVKSLVFWVDELDGETAARTFSILSEKLAAQMEAFLPGRKYLQYDFIITETGSGFLKDWIIQPILLEG